MFSGKRLALLPRVAEGADEDRGFSHTELDNCIMKAIYTAQRLEGYVWLSG